MNHILTATALLLSCCACWAAPVSARPLPVLENRDGHFNLIVDGRPFLILGGQVHNSTTADQARLDRAYDTLERAQANTAFVPIYWELLEPDPGHFDFALVDRAVQGARKHHLRLVLLWFGTWKNGAINMQGMPAVRRMYTYMAAVHERATAAT